MQSITLQTSDTVVTSGDILGRLNYAASAEADGSAAILIAGSIYVQAEGSFQSSSNPAAIVFATAAADSSSAVGRIKITDNGHLVPMANNSYDLGSSDLNFRNTYTDTLYIGGTAITATATELNLLDGVSNITLGNANELLVVGSDGASIVSDSTLAVDTTNNRLGINQTSPEVTLHMTGEDAQTAQIRMEQYNNSADAPDIRTRRYRGTIASPSAVQAGDYLFRSNHEYYNGTSLIVGGTFGFDNTNNANRTQFAVSVTTDGTSADTNTASKVQFKIDGNDSGAITFNNAYKFPTSDGSANQILQTNGSGVLSFTGSPTFTGLTVDTNTLYVDSSNNRVGIGTASPAYQVEIENTSANALLVLDRTDGASTFIEGGATDSVIGSVGANDVKIAYNSVPVVTFGSGGDITTSGTVTANLFDGTATSARYADLAENYVADAQYEPGTVLIFGGQHEVTASRQPDSNKIAGVVSTAPGVLMNKDCEGEYVVALAFTGRVPTKVKGTISKGDMMVSSNIEGVAVASDNPAIGTVIGKALENYDSEEVGVIEVVVGRL